MMRVLFRRSIMRFKLFVIGICKDFSEMLLFEVSLFL